jgi:ATP-dependent DNA helicase HFM1/MER3
MDRRLDPHLQRIVDNATGMNSKGSQEGNFTYASEEQASAGWGFGPGPRHQAQEPSSFNDFGWLHLFASNLTADDFSTSGRVPFDAPYHSHPAPLTGSNRLSLAPRKMYNQPEQKPKIIINADNHFRFAQNLREGVPINPAPPRTNLMQHLRPTVQRSAPHFQSQATSQPLDSIDQLANAMLMRKSMPPMPTDAAPAKFFYSHGIQPSTVNQLQSQKQQVTPPYNLSKCEITVTVST